MSRPAGRPSGFLALAALITDERLLSAACAGRAPLFDLDPLPGEGDEQRVARLADAARVCESCPASVGCGEVAAELGRYAVGVWSGTRYGRVGRPDRESTGRSSAHGR